MIPHIAKNAHRNLLATLILLITLALSACESAEDKPNEGIAVGITGINHTKTFIAGFYIDDSYGSNLPDITEGGGGGATSCCLILPRQYRPGLTARVRWNHTEDKDNWKETTATLLPYFDGAGRAWINFLPDDRVVIFISDAAPWHRAYVGEHRAPSNPNYRGWEIEFPKMEAKP